jgi:hypothetical protein
MAEEKKKEEEAKAVDIKGDWTEDELILFKKGI